MGTYNQINHTADIAFRITGTTLEDLIVTSAAAWRNIVVDDCSIVSKDSHEVKLTADTPEELLVEFLSELNYLLLVKRWICGKIAKIKLIETEKYLELSAELIGESLQADRHHVEVEIKAVTFHKMKIEKVNKGYRTFLVFDI